MKISNVKNSSNSMIRCYLGIQETIPFREMALLAAHFSGLPFHQVLLEKEAQFTKETFEFFEKALKKREEGWPIAKIIGVKEFYGLQFQTNEYTLDPRPESELIIDLVQKYFPNKRYKHKILDLGTGTGCLALSLLTIYPFWVATLVDISKEALKVSVKNAEMLNLKDRCSFNHSNWFQAIEEKFDLIVTNPPYVEEGFALDLQTSFDPHEALFAGKKGLDAYEQIIPICSKYLSSQGMIFVEIGKGQAEAVSEMFSSNMQIQEVAKDLQGIERTIVAVLKS